MDALLLSSALLLCPYPRPGGIITTQGKHTTAIEGLSQGRRIVFHAGGVPEARWLSVRLPHIEQNYGWRGRRERKPHPNRRTAYRVDELSSKLDAQP
jgi:hypothetical protein